MLFTTSTIRRSWNCTARGPTVTWYSFHLNTGATAGDRRGAQEVLVQEPPESYNLQARGSHQETAVTAVGPCARQTVLHSVFGKLKYAPYGNKDSIMKGRNMQSPT